MIPQGYGTLLALLVGTPISERPAMRPTHRHPEWIDVGSAKIPRGCIPRACKKCGSTDWIANGPGKTRCHACHARFNFAWYRSKPREYHNAKSQAYRARRRALARAVDAVYREWRPTRMLFRNARYRARQLGLPFTITEADIHIPSHCPVLGVPLEHGRAKVGPCSPSLDRLNPSLGYVPGNIAVISHRANTIKRDADSATVYRVADWMKSQGL